METTLFLIIYSSAFPYAYIYVGYIYKTKFLISVREALSTTGLFQRLSKSLWAFDDTPADICEQIDVYTPR